MDGATSRSGGVTRRSLLAVGATTAVLCGSSRASGRSMNPRLSIADPQSFVLQPASMIQRRFDMYKQIGVGTLRVGLGWWGQEFGDGNWAASNRLPYFRLAVQNGFRLKMQIGTLSATPQWFMDKYPAARILSRDRRASVSDISYWYPDLHAILSAKADHLFGYLAEQGLFNSIDSVILDCGPAGEPIYPAAWTLPAGATVANESFWFYDPYAQASFAPAMNTQYGGALDVANRAWGTSFTTWSNVQVPEPGTRPGPMWRDVLTWYRDTKRSFVAWQVANYKTLLQRYARSTMPTLLLMVPGSHISNAEWLAAIGSGDGDYGVKIMSDSEYLLDLAADTGCWLQYTGVENGAEVAYLQSYMNSSGKQVPMWGENAGSLQVGRNPQLIADVIKQNDLYGFEFIGAGFVFDKAGINPNEIFRKLAHAYSTALSSQ